MIMRLLLIAALTFFFASSRAQQPDAARYPLIPWPASLTPAHGEVVIDKYSAIASEAKFANEYAYLRNLLGHYLGQTAVPGKSATTIVLKDDPTLTAPESYRLSIANNTIILAAHSPAG